MTFTSIESTEEGTGSICKYLEIEKILKKTMWLPKFQFPTINDYIFKIIPLRSFMPVNICLEVNEVYLPWESNHFKLLRCCFVF